MRAGAYSAAWRYCCRLTANREDAEELLQDSLAHALPRYAQLRRSETFRGWLLAIVRTRFLTSLRQQRRVVPLEAELLDRLAADPEPEAELLLSALRGLPPAQRELLQLFYLEDLSLAELGRVLGVPAMAVRHRLHRAREALRRELQRAGQLIPLHNPGRK